MNLAKSAKMMTNTAFEVPVAINHAHHEKIALKQTIATTKIHVHFATATQTHVKKVSHARPTTTVKKINAIQQTLHLVKAIYSNSVFSEFVIKLLAPRILTALTSPHIVKRVSATTAQMNVTMMTHTPAQE
jgi:hypothetical protein